MAFKCCLRRVVAWAVCAGIVGGTAGCAFRAQPVAGGSGDEAVLAADGGVAAVTRMAGAAGMPASGAPGSMVGGAAGSTVGGAAVSGGGAGRAPLAAAGGSAPIASAAPSKPAKVPATDFDDDAGSKPGVDPQQSAQDTACAFEFSACLLANPTGYAECARMNAEHCDLLASSGSSTQKADGGTQPSAACSLQEADCIMRMPERASECVKMLESCTL